MALFKKKNAQAEESSEKETVSEIKLKVLNALNEKLQGTIYDNCIIMPKGFTIDVQIGKQDEKDGIVLLQTIFIVKNDELFDEPLIDPVDAQGTNEDEAAKMASEIFFGGVWHPLDQSMYKKNPVHISVNYLKQHYDFDMYSQSVVRIGIKDKQPVMLMNYIKAELPKYLGSKKYYWIRVYLSRYKDRKIVEVRVNGSVCNELARFYQAYVDAWDDPDTFKCEKQYGIFVQREDDKCPFTKDVVVDSARKAVEMMENCNSREEYIELAKKLEEITEENLKEIHEGNSESTLSADDITNLAKSLAAEIRIFIPEILAKLTLGYREGDSLFIIEGDSNIEFKKSQLRSYFYLQQVVLEYLSKRPEQENVTKIVTNSVAFRELRKAHEQGHEPKDLYVPGTSYKIGTENYKVW